MSLNIVSKLKVHLRICNLLDLSKYLIIIKLVIIYDDLKVYSLFFRNLASNYTK